MFLRLSLFWVSALCLLCPEKAKVGVDELWELSGTPQPVWGSLNGFTHEWGQVKSMGD